MSRFLFWKCTVAEFYKIVILHLFLALEKLYDEVYQMLKRSINVLISKPEGASFLLHLIKSKPKSLNVQIGDSTCGFRF